MQVGHKGKAGAGGHVWAAAQSPARFSDVCYLFTEVRADSCRSLPSVRETESALA